MVSPHAGDFVDQRFCRVRVFRHRHDRKIRGHIGEHQGEKGERDEDKAAKRRASSHGHDTDVATRGAEQSGERLNHGKSKREAKSKLAEFAGHDAPAPPCPSCQWPERFSASTTSGGIYRSSCLARTSLAVKVPSRLRVPSATTPWPSRNRSGSTPEYFTGTAFFPSVTVNWISRPRSRLTLPFSTNPPIRKVRPAGTLSGCAAISLGL